MNDVEQWYSAGPGCRAGREILVRAWKPGDGLRCTAAGYQGRNPCGAPVAVVNDVQHGKPGSYEAKSITRVVCLKHLSARFGGGSPSAQDNNTNHAALEELASRHWDEYQKILTLAREQLMRDRLSILPKDLQDKVIELLEQEQAEGVVA